MILFNFLTVQNKWLHNFRFHTFPSYCKLTSSIWVEPWYLYFHSSPLPHVYIFLPSTTFVSFTNASFHFPFPFSFTFLNELTYSFPLSHPLLHPLQTLSFSSFPSPPLFSFLYFFLDHTDSLGLKRMMWRREGGQEEDEEEERGKERITLKKRQWEMQWITCMRYFEKHPMTVQATRTSPRHVSGRTKSWACSKLLHLVKALLECWCIKLKD